MGVVDADRQTTAVTASTTSHIALLSSLIGVDDTLMFAVIH